MVAGLALLTATAAGDAAAQLPSSAGTPSDVTPPMAIAGLDVRPAPPMEFSRAWLAKAEAVRRRRAELQAEDGLDGLDPAALAERGAALSGQLRVPVIPIRYADVEAPFPVQVLVDRLFGTVRGDTMSYAAYWREVSAGQLTVTGAVSTWIQLSRKASHYLPASGFGWARYGRIQEIRDEALLAADAAYDFGDFDNDGPDGLPNSGDDDGYVDFIALVYAVRCGSNGARAGAVWPHRGALAPFETDDVSASGGRIKVTDYVIQPAQDPRTCAPMHIGVLAHETGHAFGLPDLYDYDGSSQGIGGWGLMGTGSHGTEYSPAHLSAWEKEQLGWVRTERLPLGVSELRLPPVEQEPVVYRYEIPDTRGEYLLLENRQRIGSDSRLPGTGLLVWRIDPERGELGAWNSDERWNAVQLMAADGRDDLARGRAADAADPYPGKGGRTRFDVEGAPMMRLARIRESDGVLLADVEVPQILSGTVAPPRQVGLFAVPGDTTAASPLLIPVIDHGVQWSSTRGSRWLRLRRTGDTLWVAADARRLKPGAYADTVMLWPARSGEPERRVIVHLRVARPAMAEIVAEELPWSWGLAARDGRVLQASFGWDPLGMRPRPRVLQLLDGYPQPETLSRLPAEALFAPVAALDSGVYVLAAARGHTYLYRIQPSGNAELVGGDLGDTPVYGAAALADGTVLVSDWSGAIRRIHPDGSVHAWVTSSTDRFYQITADGAGTVYAATWSGDILRVDTAGRSVRLRTGFGEGRLVAVAAAADGTLYAAERGGSGRILRLHADGSRVTVGLVKGAEFFGLAVDGSFLYAADLRNRKLLRFPVGPPETLLAAAPEP